MGHGTHGARSRRGTFGPGASISGLAREPRRCATTYVGELVHQHGDTIDERLPHVHPRELPTTRQHRQRIEAQDGRQRGAVLTHNLMRIGGPVVPEHAWRRDARPRHHDALAAYHHPGRAAAPSCAMRARRAARTARRRRTPAGAAPTPKSSYTVRPKGHRRPLPRRPTQPAIPTASVGSIERNAMTSTVRIASNTTPARDHQRRQPRDRTRRVAALGMPRVPILLQTEPEGSARNRHPLHTRRRIRRHPRRPRMTPSRRENETPSCRANTT